MICFARKLLYVLLIHQAVFASSIDLFLTKGKQVVKKQRKLDIANVKLADKPLVAFNNIDQYCWGSHSLTFKKEKNKAVDSLPNGTVIIICLDSKPLYHYVKWCGLLSSSYGGLVMLAKGIPGGDEYHIDLGYPTKKYYTGGSDPRNNVQVFEAFRKSGKLEYTANDSVSLYKSRTNGKLFAKTYSR